MSEEEIHSDCGVMEENDDMSVESNESVDVEDPESLSDQELADDEESYADLSEEEEEALWTHLLSKIGSCQHLRHSER